MQFIFAARMADPLFNKPCFKPLKLPTARAHTQTGLLNNLMQRSPSFGPPSNVPDAPDVPTRTTVFGVAPRESASVPPDASAHRPPAEGTTAAAPLPMTALDPQTWPPLSSGPGGHPPRGPGPVVWPRILQGQQGNAFTREPLLFNELIFKHTLN